MKKKIYLILISIISFMILIPKVDAVVMYLDCYVDDRCKSAENGWFEWGWKCMTGMHKFARFTKNDGSMDYFIINSKDNDYYLFENDDYCWLKGNFTNMEKNCNDDTMYDEKYTEILNEGNCPLGVRTQKAEKNDPNVTGWTEFVPVGKTKEHKQMEVLEAAQFIVYSFIDGNGKTRKIAEGYNSNGAYCFVGPDLVKAIYDENLFHHRNLIKNIGGNYFKVESVFESLMIAGKGLDIDDISVCKKGKDDCIANHGFNVLIDSQDSNRAIYNGIEQWYQSSEDQLAQYSKLLEMANNQTFNNACNDLNNSMQAGEHYNFKEYTVQEMITDLEKAYDGLETAYAEDAEFIDFTTGEAIDGAVSSAASYIYNNVLKVKDLIDMAEENDEEYNINKGSLENAILRKVEVKLEEFLDIGSYKINIVDITQDLREYVTLYYTATSYLNSNSSLFGLTSLEQDRVQKLKEKFEELVRVKTLNIFPVTDCKSLLGDKLIAKINSYLNIIKIAIPIILIGLGIIDFTKAVFAGDEGSMKSAQSTFIKRLGISILIFLTPTIINLILQLANKVWLIISPNSCGLFES